MRVESIFAIGLIFALLLLVFYIGLIFWVLIIIINDWKKRGEVNK